MPARKDRHKGGRESGRNEWVKSPWVKWWIPNVPNASFWCKSALMESLLTKGGHPEICRLPNSGQQTSDRLGHNNKAKGETFHVSQDWLSFGKWLTRQVCFIRSLVCPFSASPPCFTFYRPFSVGQLWHKQRWWRCHFYIITDGQSQSSYPALFIYHERQLFLSCLFIKTQPPVYYFNLTGPRPCGDDCKHKESPPDDVCWFSILSFSLIALSGLGPASGPRMPGPPALHLFNALLLHLGQGQEVPRSRSSEKGAFSFICSKI